MLCPPMVPFYPLFVWWYHAILLMVTLKLHHSGGTAVDTRPKVRCIWVKAANSGDYSGPRYQVVKWETETQASTNIQYCLLENMNYNSQYAIALRYPLYVGVIKQSYFMLRRVTCMYLYHRLSYWSELAILITSMPAKLFISSSGH